MFNTSANVSTHIFNATGSDDTVALNGFHFDNPHNAFLYDARTVDGSLVVTWTQEGFQTSALRLDDWLNPENRVETFITEDDVLSFAEFKDQLESWEHYQGEQADSLYAPVSPGISGVDSYRHVVTPIDFDAQEYALLNPELLAQYSITDIDALTDHFHDYGLGEQQYTQYGAADLSPAINHAASYGLGGDLYGPMHPDPLSLLSMPSATAEMAF